MNIRIYQIDTDKNTHRVAFDSLDLMKKYTGKDMPDASIYENVFDGNVDCKNLEEVYETFNLHHPPEFRGYSLSVSDIVEVIDAPKLVGKITYLNTGLSSDYTDFLEYTLAQERLREDDVDYEAHDYVGLDIPSVEPGFYYCDSFGFKKVEFDASLVKQDTDLLQVVLCEPQEKARIVKIGSSLRNMQCAVRGEIEVITPFMDNACVILNRDGKLDELPPNRVLYGKDGKTPVDVIAGTFFICGTKGEEFTSLSAQQLEHYRRMFDTPERIDFTPNNRIKVFTSLSDMIKHAENISKNQNVEFAKENIDKDKITFWMSTDFLNKPVSMFDNRFVKDEGYACFVATAILKNEDIRDYNPAGKHPVDIMNQLSLRDAKNEFRALGLEKYIPKEKNAEMDGR